jgi:hypothetical protein
MSEKMNSTHFKSELINELNRIFDSKLQDRIKRLRSLALTPLAFILFTRIAELSAMINELVELTEYGLEEMFARRRRFSRMFLNTFKDILFDIYIMEVKEAKMLYIEDMIYVLQRLDHIQSEIDELILEKLSGKEVVRFYRILIRFLLGMMSSNEVVPDRSGDVVKDLERIEEMVRELKNKLGYWGD